jgi:methylisocitrate lyase
MGAIEDGLRAIAQHGTQEELVPRMQTRARLYELLGYADYAALDADVFNFTLTDGGTR